MTDGRPVGRPTDYSEELTDTICDRLILGESLVEICDDDAMPCETSVYRWLAANEKFRDKYTQARALQAERRVDEVITISDDGRNDWMVRKGKDGGYEEVLNNEHVARSRLRVEARLKLIPLLAPKKYGPKIDMNHSGNVTITRRSYADAPDTAPVAD